MVGVTANQGQWHWQRAYYILIVKDDSEVAYLIEQEFVYEGYKVCAIHHSAAGLMTIRGSNPDLVILGYSALELLERRGCSPVQWFLIFSPNLFEGEL
ncbi:hypothetical protein H6G89_33655 [Oscillatoria sp. FACHB-1407]|uniref:hypothetical protein n=1 Tax=Oscillatoria sp. FACHB-1407 TaxID=2692847 RepID=UPI0016832BB3|nr:hypothetical protein [Oscillatoria sp. FACHB-1407]MBD2465934.1 hypothetical protein [Oscillatoria sp. FACHB-1407]